MGFEGVAWTGCGIVVISCFVMKASPNVTYPAWFHGLLQL